jgi:hypothetical protein
VNLFEKLCVSVRSFSFCHDPILKHFNAYDPTAQTFNTDNTDGQTIIEITN